MEQRSMVLVECVWPASRGPKDDCRGGTKTVWSGRGDVQPYPAELWPKLAAHPDVWRLVTREEIQARIEAAQAENARLLDLRAAAEKAEAQRNEADRLAAQALRDQQQSQGADSVLITKVNVPEGERASGTSAGEVLEDPLATGDAVSSTTTTSTPAETTTQVPPPPPPPLDSAHEYSAAELAAMEDDKVRRVAEEREYGLNPRLGSANLRKYFLAEQAARAQKKAA